VQKILFLNAGRGHGFASIAEECRENFHHFGYNKGKTFEQVRRANRVAISSIKNPSVLQTDTHFN
jgi:hypothetical protein